MWKDSETKSDYLNFDYLIDAVESIAMDAKLTPSTIGVYGDWGSGKSSLMQMVEEKIILNTLDMMAQSYEPDGTPLGRNYILYAYCLMSNHIHLLIREREDTIGMAIKRIASSDVYYYNNKYSRDGHFFSRAV